MKDTLTDANFPRTADHRVYHLGLRPGEVANRIVTVGSPSRARTIAGHFDAHPVPFVLSSERGFLTITGRYGGIPISVVSIGMGSPNMDFFVREARECLSGDMAIIRLGSCGALIDIPVGSVVVPKASVAVNRNVDFDFVNLANREEPPYRISRPVLADTTLHQEVIIMIFYSSQGRQTSFPDQNAGLIEQLQKSTEDLATLEMETFHLYHLAACWGGRNVTPISSANIASPDTVIRAAAAQMVFASRTSQEFITPSKFVLIGKSSMDNRF
ncbi:nucleoside phosphorylase domain-containing protein [Infundibulicybe gibba]|nr:nucleoside phosphorylase domain-containing protein [Infundibulicybe gibba]